MEEEFFYGGKAELEFVELWALLERGVLLL